MNRRAFLRVSGAALAGASVMLEACGIAPAAPAAPAATASSRPAPASGAAAKPARLTLPTYVANPIPPPDFPPTADGLQAGYLTYPKQLVKSVPQAPGRGGDITGIVSSVFALPPAVDQNSAWQAVNKAVNANMKVQTVPSADYPTRIATTMAGSDHPDLLYLNNANISISGIPQFLQTSYADLTPYVSGDAIKDYPNLASFPSTPWKPTVYGGLIRAIPVVRPYFQWVWYYNQGMFEGIGAGQPKNADDFKRILKELTSPQANQWGMGAVAPSYGLISPGGSPQMAMFGAPNNWAVDANGKFVKDIETEQFNAALGFVRDLYAAGVFYPDELNGQTLRTQFLASKFAVFISGWASYQGVLWASAIKLNPPLKVRTLDPFSSDGNKPIWHQYFGLIGQTAVKNGPPERIRELLGVLNFMAAPFGSEEYQLLTYGLTDVHFKVDAAGNPVATDKAAEVNVGWGYLATSPPVLYDPNDPEYVRVAYAAEQAMLPHMIPDPSVGLWSPTDATRGAQLLQRFTDGIGDIVTGRSPMSALSQLLDTWRSMGGDQIRSEYQQEYANAG